MKKITLLVILIVIIIVAVAGYFACKYETNKRAVAAISSFQECAAKGYPVMESYPRQCKTPDGRNFTEDIGNELEKIDLIKIQTPRPNDIVKSPLEIKGEARGFWFFEASFPIKLVDANGKEIPITPTYATAQGEWMTENFVPFEAQIEFQKPATKTGTLILEKDNPSDLPQNADQLTIPITFQ